MNGVPSHPYALTICWRDHRVQVREYETLATALAAAESLRPALVSSWRLAITLDARTFPDTLKAHGSFERPHPHQM
jgi:hypothetical protein